MARKAGSIVVDRLRERILLGRYFGCWSPGDRLPSVRDVASLEDVDRKTAAAAYRRLQQERLVRIEPRSGVYLNGDETTQNAGDPLRRLHHQWLEQTMRTAAELGLESATVARLIQAVTAVQARRIPVADDDEGHAELMARELRTRTGLDCTSCRSRDLPARSGPLRSAPFVVATPAIALRLRARPQALPIVHATVAPELLKDVASRAEQGDVAVVVSTSGLARELGLAIEHGLVGARERVRVVHVTRPADLNGVGKDGTQVVLWPGAPAWAADHLNGRGFSRSSSSLLSDRTLAGIRSHVARWALDHVNRSSAGARPGATAGPTR